MRQPAWSAGHPRVLRILIYVGVGVALFWTIWLVGFYVFQTGGAIPDDGRGDIVQTP
jgi:hypothetical protein